MVALYYICCPSLGRGNSPADPETAGSPRSQRSLPWEENNALKSCNRIVLLKYRSIWIQTIIIYLIFFDRAVDFLWLLDPTCCLAYVTLQTPSPRGWVATARTCSQKVARKLTGKVSSPIFPWLDACLVVTKQETLKMETSL